MTSTDTKPVRPSQSTRRFDFDSKTTVLSERKLVIVSQFENLPAVLKTVVEDSGCDDKVLSLDGVRNLRQNEWASIDAVIVSPSVSAELRAEELVFQDIANSPQIVVLKEEGESFDSSDDSILELSSPYDGSLKAFLVGLWRSNRYQIKLSDFADKMNVFMRA